MMPAALALVFIIFSAVSGATHEVRPGMLQLTETAPDRFDMLWRIPARGDMALALTPVLPESCATADLPVLLQDGVRFEERRQIVCDGGLGGVSLRIDGLERVQTDVLVSVTYLSGGTETLRASPKAPFVVLEGQQSLAQVSATYLWLGTEHILLGIDHLLFVTALLFLVSGWRHLVGTVTAFTLAHSITLAGAALGLLSAPSGLVEALIALSIVVVAAEVVLKNRGQAGIATRRPWLIAFGFGLLHGFGFAGALSEIGLPAHAVPAALLFFNLGVEAGQILFVAVLLVAGWAANRILPPADLMLRRVIPVGIGIMAGFWAVERTLAIWA